MTKQQPINPPDELVQQWLSEPEYGTPGRVTLHTISEQRLIRLLTRAAQWGADEKLNACKEWLKLNLMKHDLYEGYAYLYDDCSQAYIREKELLKDLQEAMRPTTTQEDN